MPLISIGIPTYQRVQTLARALESARAQTHSPLEIVISDNASSDGTQELCTAAAAGDHRIRYLRQERNVGPTANFNRLFDACSGDYVLMLADDDWLDAGYAAACLELLRSEPSPALVAGLARYRRQGEFVTDGVVHQHSQRDPSARVRDYLAHVDDNGVFYGLMPRHVLQAARPFPNVLGNDWLHVARIACQGTIVMREDVHIHRELGGTSADIASILSTFGRGTWQARIPQLVMAWQLLRDIGWAHPVYEPLGRPRRLLLGIRGALASVRWQAFAWHLVTPTVARLGRRRLTKPVWTLYVRLTRALGAGRRA